MQVDEKVENFLADSSDFIEEFEPIFVDYFVFLCLSHDKFYSKETIEKLANLIYKDVFNVNIFSTTFEEEILDEMLDNGMMIELFISRSMLFLLESYAKQGSYKHMETFVLCISEYINEFEKRICGKNRIQPLHLNFDTVDNFSVGNNIFDIFKKIKDKGEEVTFFNLYKGIPIKHSAFIVDIDGGDIVFKTMQTQEVAMKMDGNAYILVDDNFSKPIKADILYNNFSNNTVVLNNFTYMLNMPAMKREFARVHPDIMAEVSLSSEKELVTKGKLFDLSVDGLGVISEENNGIYAGARIDLKFVLNIAHNKDPFIIKVDGEILNIIEYSNSYRYCIKIYPKADMEEKILSYVKLREIEILDSLEEEVDFYSM